MPALLEDEPEFYPALQHIWDWFHQLCDTRGAGFGPESLTHQEIGAWYRNMQIRPRPTPWEILQIIRLDRIWFKVQAERDRDKSDKRKGKKGVKEQ